MTNFVPGLEYSNKENVDPTTYLPSRASIVFPEPISPAEVVFRELSIGAEVVIESDTPPPTTFYAPPTSPPPSPSPMLAINYEELLDLEEELRSFQSVDDNTDLVSEPEFPVFENFEDFLDYMDHGSSDTDRARMLDCVSSLEEQFSSFSV